MNNFAALLIVDGPGCPTPRSSPSDISGSGTDIITENGRCSGIGIATGCNIDTIDQRFKGDCNGSFCTTTNSGVIKSTLFICDGVIRSLIYSSFYCTGSCTHVKVNPPAGSSLTGPSGSSDSTNPPTSTNVPSPSKSGGYKKKAKVMILCLISSFLIVSYI